MWWNSVKCAERIPRVSCQIIHLCQLTHLRNANASRIERAGSRSIIDQGAMLAKQFRTVFEIDKAKFIYYQNQLNTLPRFVLAVRRWASPALVRAGHQ
jgi:hypothetical protein